mmetsp:Transcript_46425/g.82974  ORF Transcript_46425/g.82974 Transcript_46425/m.82974 type:complete len:82 (-) Transcript_46425:367-612(-)
MGRGHSPTTSYSTAVGALLKFCLHFEQASCQSKLGWTRLRMVDCPPSLPPHDHEITFPHANGRENLTYPPHSSPQRLIVLF